MDDLGIRCGLEELVHRAALVGLDVGEGDPTERLEGDDAPDRRGHERKQLPHAGVEEERLVVADQELVEGEALG